MSVLASPMLTTSRPCAATPAANAATSSGDDGACRGRRHHAGPRRLLAQQPGQRRAELTDERRVDLLTDDASDVVRLDHGGQVVGGGNSGAAVSGATG
jgi:hypothetical protein